VYRSEKAADLRRVRARRVEGCSSAASASSRVKVSGAAIAFCNINLKLLEFALAAPLFCGYGWAREVGVGGSRRGYRGIDRAIRHGVPRDYLVPLKVPDVSRPPLEWPLGCLPLQGAGSTTEESDDCGR
jgi:hypothetical protein